MDALLDMVSIATNAAYIAFFLLGVWAEHRTGTLAALRKAGQRYWTAAALATLAVAIKLASVPYDGWWRVVMACLTLAACVACAVLVNRRHDRKAIQEMQNDLERDR